MAIEIRISGLRATRRTLLRVRALAQEKVRAHRQTIEAIVNESYERQFASSGAAFGKAWRALAPSTIVRKRQLGAPNPSKPLVRSGQLRASLTGQARRGRRVTMRAQSLRVVNTLDTQEGAGLISSIEAHGRRVVHPQTGIGPGGVRRLERLWERIADEIVAGLEA